MMTYFPSCNFNAMCPETAKKIAAYLTPRMPETVCCRLDKNAYAADDVGIYLCQACREVMTENLHVGTLSLWEYIDADESFRFPDYSGFKATVQDCWRDREHPEVHNAVRSLLRKMNVEFADIEGEAREKSRFCGDLHYEPQRPENIAIVEEYAAKGEPLFKAPPEVMAQLMREQAEKITTEWVVTDCNRCTRTLRAGGANAVHLAELVFGDGEVGAP